jgi:hypothetical protein
MPADPSSLQLLAPSANPEEAAAIVAAIERFMRDTAPAPAARADAPDPWVQAAMLESVSRWD